MANGTLPSKQADLVTWGDNFVSFITTGFATYGLTSAQSAEFIAAQTAWKTAYEEANNSATRTKPKIAAKDDQLKLFRKQAMKTVSIVRGFSGITNELLLDLRIDVPPAHRPPLPVPGQMIIDIVAVRGNIVDLALHGEGEGASLRKRPAGTKGATIVYHIGATAPVDPAGWSLFGNTSLTKFSVVFPAGTPAGTKVFVAGFWFNYRTESGAFATPQSAELGYSGVVAPTMTLAQAA